MTRLHGTGTMVRASLDAPVLQTSHGAVVCETCRRQIEFFTDHAIGYSMQRCRCGTRRLTPQSAERHGRHAGPKRPRVERRCPCDRSYTTWADAPCELCPACRNLAGHHRRKNGKQGKPA